MDRIEDRDWAEKESPKRLNLLRFEIAPMEPSALPVLETICVYGHGVQCSSDPELPRKFQYSGWQINYGALDERIPCYRRAHAPAADGDAIREPETFRGRTVRSEGNRSVF